MRGSPETRRGLRPAVIYGAAGTVLALIAAVLLPIGLAAETKPVLPDRGIPVATVLDEPNRYVGREITVTGTVDILTERVLSLGEGDLTVVANGPGAPALNTSGFGVGEVVYATGTLRVLSADGVTELLPGPSLLPSQFVQGFERQPVLLADEVVPAS